MECFLLEAKCTNNLGERSFWHEEGEGLEEEHKEVSFAPSHQGRMGIRSGIHLKASEGLS